MKRCTVGGQAVLEGVMMRTPAGGVAVAVRKSDGSIVTEYTEYPTRAKKGTFLGWPVVRGVVAFVESLVTGMRITMRSAELFGEEEAQEQPSRFERWLAEKLGKSAMDIMMGVAVVLAVLLALGLFFFLPTFVTQLIPWHETARTIWKSLTEGGVRLLVFVLYLVAISAMKDVRRLFMYHGAEHKTIFCYEAGLPLTVENVRKQPLHHPRCGTSFLLIVMVISILVFSIIPWQQESFTHIPVIGVMFSAMPWAIWRLILRLLLLPIVAGISYEIIKFAGRHDNWFTRAISAPGMWFQLITTNEPEDDQIEVAIRSLKAVIPEDKTADVW